MKFALAILALMTFMVVGSFAYCETSPFAVQLNWNYSTALEPATPRNFTGRVIVLTGGVSKEERLGQAGNLADLLYQEDNAIVFTISRNPIFSGVSWENHYQGDIENQGQVRAFWRWVQSTLETKYGLPTTKIVSGLGLIAGQPLWAYNQDTGRGTLEKQLLNNLLGNYDVEDVARSSDFDMLTDDAIVHYTISTAAFFPTGDLNGYEMAKAAIMTHVQQNVLHDLRNGSLIRNIGFFPDAVCNTSIPVDSEEPSVKVEMCAALIGDRSARNPFDCVPPQFNFPFTTARDSAKMTRAIWRGYEPDATFFIVNSPRPIDIDGGDMMKWLKLRFNASPKCYAQSWLDKSANVGKSAKCSAAWGPRKFH